MMRRRMGRPGLLGTAARTAVVAGTATAVSGKVHQHQQAQAQQAQAAQAQQVPAQAAPPAPAPAPEAPATDTIARLQQLADMKQQGLLTDEEFAALKAQLLAG